jgi:NADH:ubiquinone oxidoreductase subunit 5 (chain L)/Multisubunit Na+/H+ antiporter, MnhA subunit
MKGEERFQLIMLSWFVYIFNVRIGCFEQSFPDYMFWELVGVSSYLLIGYYYDKPSAVAASKKAFIVTRFADLGFLVGILILAFYGETLDFKTLIANLTSQQSSQFLAITTASFVGVSALTWGLTLIFIGGAVNQQCSHCISGCRMQWKAPLLFLH